MIYAIADEHTFFAMNPVWPSDICDKDKYSNRGRTSVNFIV